MAESSLTSAAIPAALPPPAPPALVDLRPLTTSELIDRGFSLYRAHFAGFLLLALLCQSAPLLTQIMATGFQLSPTQTELLATPNTFLWKVAALTTIALFAQVAVFCFEVVITFFIGDAYLGKVPSVKRSLQQFGSCALASIWTCILSRILFGLTLIFPVLAMVGLYVWWLLDPPTTLMPLLVFAGSAVFLLVVSLVPMLVVSMRRLMITIPALAFEGRSGWQAMRRASELVRYDPGFGIFYWGTMRLSFLLLPLFVIELLILSLTSLPVTLQQIGEVMRHSTDGQMSAPPESVMIISQVMTFLAGSLILPLYSIATTLFYYDIRIRREGFDLEFMAGRLGGHR
jgi:hypothetical protein